MPALVVMSSLLAAACGGSSHTPPAAVTPARKPAPPPAAPVAAPTPAPPPTPGPAPAVIPARSATTTPARELRDPERCKRPTRAYPRWCADLEKSRVTEKKP
jgi:hypothetical protein